MPTGIPGSHAVCLIEGHIEGVKPKDGRKYCKTCSATQARASWHKNKEMHILTLQKRVRKMKTQIFEAYGGAKCQCCGEDRFEFLTIDHINGGGNTHRKEIGGGRAIYYWIIRNNFPVGFRILCMNCNWATGQYGQCPHETERERTRQDITEYYRQLAGWRV